MTAAIRNSNCGSIRIDVHRRACGETLSPQALRDVDRHLAVCADCRVILAETADVAAMLSRELAPGAASTAQTQQILRRIDAALKPAQRVIAMPRFAGFAAAACVLFGFLWTPSRDAAPPQTATPVMSSADRTELFSAIALLEWDDPLSDALTTLDDQLTAARSSLFGEAATAQNNKDDDWDLPSEEPSGARSAPGTRFPQRAAELPT
ncbi:MAG: hypothetical protein U1D55_12085 [Phycisphaerae bacterium]